MFSSGAGLLVTGFINCTGSEQKLFDECFNILSEHNNCSQVVVNCKQGMNNLNF